MISIAEKVQNDFRHFSIKTLCASYEATNTLNYECTETVKGWIFDELNQRNPDNFQDWLMTTELELQDKPSHFYL